MRLATFLERHGSDVLAEWDAFARSIPAARAMSSDDVRNHAHAMLRAIAADMRTPQTEGQRERKGKGLGPALDAASPAALHGVARQLHGFTLDEMTSEFRALRAAALRLWQRHPLDPASVLEDVIRFDEAVDLAWTEAIAAHQTRTADTRETFLGILGHDLRTPLAVLSNCVTLLADARTSVEQRRRFAEIGGRSVAAMDGLITDVLAYARSRLGRGIEVVPRPGNLGAICSRAVDEARVAHPHRTFVLRASGDATCPFDAARMDQVLANLLGNAVKHGAPEAPIEVDLRVDGDAITVGVRNQGPPIPASAFGRIFEPLVQLPEREPASERRKPAGLGLGLFIARHVVDAHGGRIEVASGADGTVFTVSLPRHGAPPAG